VILGINTRLLSKLEPAAECRCLTARSEMIADAFMTLMPFLKSYSSYCAGYFGALERLAQLRSSMSSFDTAIKDVETRKMAEAHARGESTADLTLPACLIAPVKRLCLYPLVLAAILDTQQRATHQTLKWRQQQTNQRPASPESRSLGPLRMAVARMKEMAEQVGARSREIARCSGRRSHVLASLGR